MRRGLQLSTRSGSGRHWRGTCRASGAFCSVILPTHCPPCLPTARRPSLTGLIGVPQLVRCRTCEKAENDGQTNGGSAGQKCIIPALKEPAQLIRAVIDTNVFQLSQLGTFADPLTKVLRNGKRALLTPAIDAEVAALLSGHADKRTDDGPQPLVRHGHLPEREIMTGIGPVAVRCPRVRDRVDEGSERIRFTSAILPSYAH